MEVAVESTVVSGPFRPLRRRPVLMVLAAAVLSDIGTWVQIIVVASMVAIETGSAVQSSLLALALFVPEGLVSSVGGLLADRFDRRRTFALALAGQAAATSVVAAMLAAGVRSPLVLAAVIAVGSVFSACGLPSFEAMIPDMVPADEVAAVVSLSIQSWSIGRIVGPLTGAALALVFGPAVIVGLNAVTYAVAALAVIVLPVRSHAPHSANDSLLGRLCVGWRAAISTPGCRRGIVMDVIFQMGVSPFMELVPLYVYLNLGGGRTQIATMIACQGAGGVAGTTLVGMLGSRFDRRVVANWTIVVMVAAFLCYGQTDRILVAQMAIVVLGGCGASTFVFARSLVVSSAPEGERGRVAGVAQTANGVAYAVGVLWISFLADATTLRTSFTVAGLASAVAFVVAMRPARRQMVRTSTPTRLRKAETDG